MRYVCIFCYVYILIFSIITFESHSFRTFSDDDVKVYREKVVQMFQHAYDHYLKSAYPYDELQPISCRGMDTWGSFSLTLIDALDTLVVMKNYSEFRRVVNTLLSTADFNVNINVSVFETNIRVVGGLLSAHLLSKRAGLDVDPGWPCSGPLLNLAEQVARRLLPAFETKTGMPFGTVNLLHGVPEGETPITCTAGVSTFIVEFGTLSHLTGDPIFEKVAVNALNALWKRRSPMGLVGNHINVQDGKWTALDSGIGGGVDSYFEYLVKGAILFQEPKYLKMFREYEKLISKFMKRDDWYFWVSMNSGQITLPTFQSLEAFWPGLLTLVGDIEQAVKTLYNYHQIWKQYGFTPEIYDVAHSHAKRENYPLRPELVESVMYLYYATKDHHLLEIGVDILESIEHSAKTECGYATIKNVLDHKTEDRMESFFLAETTKYLYLLFDPDNFIHNNGSCGELIQMSGGNCLIGGGGYVFNTEAHPIDIGAVYCCSAKHQDHELLLYEFQKNLDLHSLLEIKDNEEFFKVFKGNRKQNPRQANSKSINLAEVNVTATRIVPNNYSMNKKEPSVSFSFFSDVWNETIENSSYNTMFSASFTFENYKKLLLSFYKRNSTTKNKYNSLSNINSGLSETILVNINSANIFVKNNGVLNSFSEESGISNSTYEQLQLKNNSSLAPLENQSYEINGNFFDTNVFNKTILQNSNVTSIDNDNCLQEDEEEAKVLQQIHNENFYNYEILKCPIQPFLSRLNVMGEMFNV
ncbi:ER degradation-enhancing alpha-mannosidase-like protein 2 [Parasteatoda tepidariorum]|uniref:ER degradation-enhancing alpha-mannosidase-like protein 2 n=1 Tax=Parasteatoda tepidariorum TaxID=114398 RepID=UPI00077FCA53|nr:ER degradation-enhancing alpha-mannosidase-like protein 2 [Parasteatoda tepidariorum]